MTITGSDLKFVASERMIDNLSSVTGVGGGGEMGSLVIQDGTPENNVFPDVMPSNRVSGVEQYRKVFAAAYSDNNEIVYNAQVGLYARPSDANVFENLVAERSGDVFTYTALPDTRYDLSFQIRTDGFLNSTYNLGANVATITGGVSGNVAYTVAVNSGFSLNVGDSVYIGLSDDLFKIPLSYLTGGFRTVTALDSGPNTFTVSGPAFSRYESTLYIWKHARTVKLSSLALSTAGVSAAATTITVDRMYARVQQASGSYLIATAGKQPLFFEGDAVLIQHPTTLGTRELKLITRVNYATSTLTFASGLANAYTTGAGVSVPVDIGSLQSQLGSASFMLQAWLKNWSDTPTGPSTSGRYAGTIGLNNQGTINDRWAVVFDSATTFKLFSQRRGQVATGSTGTNFSPQNPATLKPYFTLYSTGWGGGSLLPGNAFRFQTLAAAGGVWVQRVVLPSSAGGSDQGTLFIRGDVDA